MMLTSYAPVLKYNQIPCLLQMSLLQYILATEHGKTLTWAVVYEKKNFSAPFSVHIFSNEFVLPHARAFGGNGLSLRVPFLLSQ